jgi:hypothetical protein
MPFWDPSKQVLLEKSPPNLMRMRFLQTLFPGARFVMIVRHPIAVMAATRKWTKASTFELLRHWMVCHEAFLDDATRIINLRIVRYEDLVARPDELVSAIFTFAGLVPFAASPPVIQGVNEQYFRWWRTQSAAASVGDRQDPHIIRAFGYSLQSPRRLRLPLPEVRPFLVRPERPGALPVTVVD